MNRAEPALCGKDRTTGYEYTALPSGGDQLVRLLEKGEAHRDCERARDGLPPRKALTPCKPASI